MTNGHCTHTTAEDRITAPPHHHPRPAEKPHVANVLIVVLQVMRMRSPLDFRLKLDRLFYFTFPKPNIHGGAISLQSPPKGVTIPYRPKPSGSPVIFAGGQVVSAVTAFYLSINLSLLPSPHLKAYSWFQLRGIVAASSVTTGLAPSVHFCHTELNDGC